MHIPADHLAAPYVSYILLLFFLLSCVVTHFLGWPTIRERPPGLIQHVLAVLVFWSWVLLLPRFPPSSRSLRLFAWASILLHGPLDSCLDLLPRSSPTTGAKTGRTAHVFTAQGGTRRDASEPRHAILKRTPTPKQFLHFTAYESLKHPPDTRS